MPTMVRRASSSTSGQFLVSLFVRERHTERVTDRQRETGTESTNDGQKGQFVYIRSVHSISLCLRETDRDRQADRQREGERDRTNDSQRTSTSGQFAVFIFVPY